MRCSIIHVDHLEANKTNQISRFNLFSSHQFEFIQINIAVLRNASREIDPANQTVKFFDSVVFPRSYRKFETTIIRRSS